MLKQLSSSPLVRPSPALLSHKNNKDKQPPSLAEDSPTDPLRSSLSLGTPLNSHSSGSPSRRPKTPQRSLLPSLKPSPPNRKPCFALSLTRDSPSLIFQDAQFPRTLSRFSLPFSRALKTRTLQKVMAQVHPLIAATHNNLLLKLQQLQHGLKTLPQRTTHTESDLHLSLIMLMICHSSAQLGIATVVHICVEMVTTIITIGADLNRAVGIRTGIHIEILMVETPIFLKEIFKDLQGHLLLLILLSFFQHLQCSPLFLPLDTMVSFKTI